MTVSAPDYTNQRQRRKPPAGKARATEKENPQAGGPVPPEKIDLRRYRSPLPQMSQEDTAQDLHLMFRMKISQARGLVANYGPDLVATAAQAVQDQIEKGFVTNPPGLLTFYLKQGAISAEDRNLYPTRKERLAALNADMNDSFD